MFFYRVYKFAFTKNDLTGQEKRFVHPDHRGRSSKMADRLENVWSNVSSLSALQLFLALLWFLFNFFFGGKNRAKIILINIYLVFPLGLLEYLKHVSEKLLMNFFSLMGNGFP